MCSLTSNKCVDDDLDSLGKAKAKKLADKLAGLAKDDDIDTAAGLELLLEPVLSWLRHDVLKTCRKYRIGNHRAIIKGRHTDCTYHWFYIKMNKKSERDREEDQRFQAQLLNALELPTSRTLPPS